MRFSILFALALAGCPTPDGGGPGVCTEVDTEGLEAGGSIVAGCYTLSEDWSIVSDVVIDDDVQITVGPGVGITIEPTGSLKVDGSPSTGVKIGGANSDPDIWVGIAFMDTASSANSLSHLTLVGACSDRWNGAGDSFGAVFVEDSARLRVEDLEVLGCSATGVHIWSRDVDIGIDGYSTNAAIPLRVSVGQAAGLSGALVHTGASAAVHLNDGVVDADVDLPAYAYRAEVDIDVTAAFTIQPGTRIAFEQNLGLDIHDGGSLSAQGTTASPIWLGGVESVSGFWKGMHFEQTNTTGSVLDWVEIHHGGSDRWHGGDDSRGGLYLEGNEVRLTMTHSVVSMAQGPALVLDGADPDGKITIASSSFEQSDRAADLTPDGSAAVDPDVQFIGNTDNRIRIWQGLFGADVLNEVVSWPARDLAYFVDDTVFVYGSLDIGAGATVIFDNDAGLSVGSWPTEGGTLTIGAAGAEEVLLTGDTASVGYWRGLYFNETLSGNRLSNVRLEYAGSSGWNGAVTSQAGIYLDDEASLELEDVTFADNELVDVFVTASSMVTSCAGVSGLVTGDPAAVYCTP